jgi:hypothetical protein
MPITMWEHCQLRNLTSQQFEALHAEIPRPAPKGSAVVAIEPRLAEMLKAIPHKNRPKKSLNIRRIKAALVGGYWRPNGETIILDSNMAVLDGDNRLTSCMETGLPLETMITWGWPTDSFASINTGIKRSPGDAASAAGRTNAYALAAAARYDWRLISKNMMTDETLPTPLIDEYLTEHDGLRASLSWGDIAHAYIPKGLAVALHYRLSMQDPAKAKQFFLDIARGENINAAQHTTWWLREVLKGYRHPTLQIGDSQKAHIAANVLKGWHAVCAGRLKKRADLLWYPARNEPFPELVYAEKQKQPRTRRESVSGASKL